MARVNVPVTSITRTGVVAPSETSGDAGNGNSVANNGSILIEVRNSNGSATTRTLSISFPTTVDGQAVVAKTYPIAAGVTKRIGPFPTKDYGTTLQLDPDHADLKLLAWRL